MLIYLRMQWVPALTEHSQPWPPDNPVQGALGAAVARHG